MDNNPPDNNESKDKSKHDQAKSETLSSSDNKKIFKYLKLLLFKYSKLILKVVGVVAGAGIIIKISIDLKDINTNVNTLSNDIVTMSTSLSSADAKSDSQAIVHNNTFPLGSGNATIYHKFQNPVQACWYYAATYITQHPYTVLWEKHLETNNPNLKIRVIADRGIWKAHTCQIDKEVDLEKIEDLLIDGDASISKDAIEKIKKDAKAYKSVYDIRDLIGENKNKEKIIELVLPEKNEDIDKIKKLLKEGYTKVDDKKINEIIQAIRGNEKLDEIKNKIKDNINRFRIIGLILKPNTIVKLIGEETINHRLEAIFHITPEDEEVIWKRIEKNEKIGKIKELFVDLEKNESKIIKLLEEGETKNIDDIIQIIRNRNNYSHITDVVATYSSTLHFDNEGKITHRRVKEVGDKEYECNYLDSGSLKSLSNNDRFKDSCSKEHAGKYKNIVTILSANIIAMIQLEKPKNLIEEKYLAALSFYLEERKKLHQNLTYDGCGAISVEPDFVTGDLTTGELETPSLVFLCHKNNIRSHVRIMVRENQQQKKERKDKAIQEEVKKREDEIRQAVMKEIKNKQSSEK